MNDDTPLATPPAISSRQRLAVAVAAAVLILWQFFGSIGALVTGGVLILLLSGLALVLVLRARPRGWVMAAGFLAGVALYVLPWSLFVARQSREAGNEADVWSWIVAVLALLALAAAAYLLAGLPRARFALDMSRTLSLAGGITLLATVAAAGLVGAAVVSRWPISVTLVLAAAAWLLLRTLRPAEAVRHLADVTTAAAAAACTLWWVFVGTLQGATAGLGMVVLAALVFVALASRTGRAVDEVSPAKAA